jgi:hypothetical protein
MRKYIFVFGALMFCALSASAQDEGSVVIKKRFERSRAAYFSVGPSVAIGKNLGDYSTGFNFEAGFLMRANKLISWGPSLSHLSFKYDDTKTYRYYYDVDNDFTLDLSQKGGNISLTSLGLNVKLNFIPVSDNSIFSFYGIVNPFVSYVSRKALKEEVDLYTYDDGNGLYDVPAGHVTYDAKPGPSQTDPGYPVLAADNKFSGGAHLGLGAELFPAKKLSYFFQITYSYTLPVSYVATESFLKDISEEDKYTNSNDPDDRIYYDAAKTIYKNDFPIIKKGFSAISIKAGLTFNF